jgi:transposase
LAGQDVSDEVIYLRAAGLDLGKRFLVACVRVPHPTQPARWSLETQKFGATPRDIRNLPQWLVERRVEVVVLEATSDYWRSVYYTLQPRLNMMLVNPQHLKGIRGRKSDPSDAAFLARAGASGLVMASFVPAQPVRELRDLTRRRTEVTVMKGQEVQRLEKELHRSYHLTSIGASEPGERLRICQAILSAAKRRRAPATTSLGNGKQQISSYELSSAFTNARPSPVRSGLRRSVRIAQRTCRRTLANS